MKLVDLLEVCDEPSIRIIKGNSRISYEYTPKDKVFGKLICNFGLYNVEKFYIKDDALEIVVKVNPLLDGYKVEDKLSYDENNF